MDTSRTDPAPSTAAVAGHPIHPMLIPFPLTFLVSAFATDLAYWGTADLFWARASLWLVGAGVISGLIAAAFGLTDFLTVRRVRQHAIGWIHALGNGAALLLSLINWLLRLDEPAEAILPWGLLLSAIVAGILAVTGWAGGELSYRHRIGVTRDV